MAFRPLPPLRAAVEAFANAQGITISDALRQLVERGLKRGGKP